ncbi:MAG: NADPH:quinone reductase [Candidatus Lloydbacteria bacterium CG22_combo_CG10-13_8_21_14_all_47_15]|uniref:NADPH:quinone reductase n=1 Tax=Candidatus Lloydbacteria bacterium CG22_combo_CG10-13_8_21_14_all_47_15 TaxID=1974635 RepID=A0A2H0CUG3_9BACT|nr:MAG: NADPH:quinone reductase [Candidatus Lloydbacteria bacterium CG22_combo_CG10-13_8_21_14_all_47_15]
MADKKKKKIFVFLGHTDPETICGFLAEQYASGAEAGGHEVRRVNISDLQFDPILHKGYKEIQELEPDLVRVQEDIKWADHIFIAYPNWWGSMPAKLKGFFDRALLPGFGFNFRDGKHLKYMTGKSARVVVTMDIMPPFFLHTRTALTMRNSILRFCGIAPVRISEIGPVKHTPANKREAWGKQFYDYGKIAV